MLITFEGIDGSGKSTQIERLYLWLVSRGREVERLREPGGTSLSEAIRTLLLHQEGPMHPLTELLLFSSARSEVVSKRVLPALERGEIVLMDRFFDSTLAYQGHGRGAASIEEIDELNRLASHGLVPDLTFYLRISPEVAASRLEGEPDRMERAGEAFFHRVVEGFDRMAQREPDRFVVLDGSAPEERIEKQIRRRVGSLLESR